MPNRTLGPSEKRQDHNVVIEPLSLSDHKLGYPPRCQISSLLRTKRKAAAGGESGEEETHRLAKLQDTFLPHRFLSLKHQGSIYASAFVWIIISIFPAA